MSVPWRYRQECVILCYNQERARAYGHCLREWIYLFLRWNGLMWKQLLEKMLKHRDWLICTRIWSTWTGWLWITERVIPMSSICCMIRELYTWIIPSWKIQRQLVMKSGLMWNCRKTGWFPYRLFGIRMIWDSGVYRNIWHMLLIIMIFLTGVSFRIRKEENQPWIIPNLSDEIRWWRLQGKWETRAEVWMKELSWKLI